MYVYCTCNSREYKNSEWGFNVVMSKRRSANNMHAVFDHSIKFIQFYSLMPGCQSVECQTRQNFSYSDRCHKVLATLPLAPVVLLTRHLGAAGIY